MSVSQFMLARPDARSAIPVGSFTGNFFEILIFFSVVIKLRIQELDLSTLLLFTLYSETSDFLVLVVRL